MKSIHNIRYIQLRYMDFQKKKKNCRLERRVNDILKHTQKASLYILKKH